MGLHSPPNGHCLWRSAWSFLIVTLSMSLLLLYWQYNSLELTEPYLSEDIRAASNDIMNEPFKPIHRNSAELIINMDHRKPVRDLEDQLRKCTDEDAEDLGPMKLTTMDEDNKPIKFVMDGKYIPISCRPHTSIAVLIPTHKNNSRLAEVLVKQLHKILQAQNVKYGIYVIRQVSSKPLNIGKLLNIGFLESLSEYPYHCVVLHSPHLVPEDSRLSYQCEESPRYLVGRVRELNQTEYQTCPDSSDDVRSVLSIQSDQFRLGGGMTNSEIIPGLVNDNLNTRMKVRRLRARRVTHDSAAFLRLPRTQQIEYHRKTYRAEAVRREMSEDGLVNLLYTLVDKSDANYLYQNLLVNIG